MSAKHTPGKLKGIMRGGYGFLLERSPRRVTVMNMGTLKKVCLMAPANVINNYDLSIFADGFLAGRDTGWGEII